MNALFSPQAREDMKGIWHRQAVEDFPSAVKQMIGMQAAIEALAESPELGRFEEDLGDAILSAQHGDVTIYFQPSEDGINVLRIY